MQVAMRGAIKDQRRDEVADLLVSIDRALEESREVRRQTDRAAEEACRGIRDALARLRAELRRASYR